MFSRINDLQNEHLHAMLPIEGYQDTPLVSLDEAIKPIIHLFNKDSLSSKVWVVKERCTNPADGLSPDQSGSIMLYTFEWLPTEESLYFILNKTLRMENRELLKPWFPFLRLFIGALIQLPSIDDVIYRGVRKDLRNEYPPNTEKIWWGFSSCTDSIHVLESDQFCGKTGTRTMFQIKCLNGPCIKNHTYFHSENEILLLPGRYLRVRSCYSSEDGLSIIRLDEIEPPHTLLKLPKNDPWRRVEPGISLLGNCMNPNCKIYEKQVIIPIGFKKFDVLVDSDASNAKCPICEKYVDTLKLGFNKCQWRISGIKQVRQSEAPAPFLENWSNTDGNSLLEYNLHNTIWRQLIVEAKPKNSN
ncbi:unnamed protein product [Rotaria sordida]|uniref:NAD(P)(+)--arginine ADP-ribosyltransferase n=1 Tax=Rotaria sordida TaxID=392033 RepID=A0A818G6M3_9BILA|nr:unnamed protein product [Rotaria sordida]CAF1294356.1 unnamed protein product [Rotaria sordida]CAF3487281.1 unnamed protein product [Rotaria sordida]CAF3742992.1 unnamed protein product [Rotaria sordida]